MSNSIEKITNSRNPIKAEMSRNSSKKTSHRRANQANRARRYGK